MASLSKSQHKDPRRERYAASLEARQQADGLVAEGMAMHRGGDFEGASARYEKALDLHPEHAGALYLLGTVHFQSKRPEQAEQLLRKSLAIQPDQPQALGNLGLALSDMKRRDEAVEALRAAARMLPNSPGMQANFGRVLRERGLHDQAVEAYRRAVALDPDNPALHSALGTALSGAERHDDAVAEHLRALELAPEKPELLNNYAHSLRRASREDEAEEVLREVVKLDPTSASYRHSLGRVLHDIGKYGEAVNNYRQARDMGVNSRGLEPSLLFFQNHLLDNDPKVLREDAIRWARNVASGVARFTDYPNVPDPERRIRVGLVSGDFREHPVGRFLEAPMRMFDRSRMSLYAYSVEDNGDGINTSLRRSIPNWRPIKDVSDEDLAAMIRRDQIDVLIDLSGHTAHHRLRTFMFKPAPVSATWLGYFATTGVEAIDYVICNDWLLPPEEEFQWVEKPWRMPSAHWCYYQPAIEAAVVPPPALTNGYVTFGCYNNFDKLNHETISAWAEIMRQVPDSRMLLRSGNQKVGVKQRVLDAFADEGFEPGERLTVDTTPLAYAQHMESYGKLDIALDPFPYNGGTTTVEALYMGVPVVTRHGDRFVAHMSESNIRSAGLDDWVADDSDDYVRRAARFAADVPFLATLRSGLREQLLASPLFDAKLFATDLEQVFRGMWRAWCETQNSPSPATKSSAS